MGRRRPPIAGRPAPDRSRRRPRRPPRLGARVLPGRANPGSSREGRHTAPVGHRLRQCPRLPPPHNGRSGAVPCLQQRRRAALRDRGTRTAADLRRGPGAGRRPGVQARRSAPARQYVAGPGPWRACPARLSLIGRPDAACRTRGTDAVRSGQHWAKAAAPRPPPSPQGLPPLARPRPHQRAYRLRPGNARPCWPGWPHRRSSYWTHGGRLAPITVAGRGGVRPSCHGPAAPSPGTSSRRSRCTRTTPSSRERPAAAAGRGATRRRRGLSVHLLRHDERLAARARGPRLPRHRGPLLARHARRRGRALHRLPVPVADESRPDPAGAPRPWHSQRAGSGLSWAINPGP